MESCKGPEAGLAHLLSQETVEARGSWAPCKRGKLAAGKERKALELDQSGVVAQKTKCRPCHLMPLYCLTPKAATQRAQAPAACQLWEREDKGQEGLWKMGKESKHSSTHV